ncbi:hypothetical protein CFBP5507_23990 [Agrobacterium salinitolerans]|uniref:Uncharacterized protein n=1 Tax=Agrobacterium salinitolerans TaxID=1183413 RepID=A0A9X9PCS0_9HYPH|nr:hypothetical protein [Agrobacterium salinitolerans]UYZ10678.1 hypothetical protein CFBP5507_23990 [Agrobacterium salinitolerans]
MSHAVEQVDEFVQFLPLTLSPDLMAAATKLARDREESRFQRGLRRPDLMQDIDAIVIF